MFTYKLLGNGITFGNEIVDILKLQGINDIEEFINPSEKHIEDVELFSTMTNAVRTLLNVLNSDNKIIDLVVDCDVDGYTSASLIYLYIKKICSSATIQIHVHKTKVHGIKDVYESLIKSKSSLIIIPDAGTNDDEYLERVIKTKKVIILDHHKADKNIIENYNLNYYKSQYNIVNNQLEDSVTDKAMTGVGIVYKFCKKVDKVLNVNYADDYLDLVALGMIADRADLTNLQSRYLVLKGLQSISDNTNFNPLISEFVRQLSYRLKGNITINNIGYYVAPLLNALIRIGTIEEKRMLFEAFVNPHCRLDKEIRGKGLVNMSIQEYMYRSCDSLKRRQDKMAEDDAKKLEEQIDTFELNKYPVIVCKLEDGMDAGITGLMSNKIASHYSKPCLILKDIGDKLTGSGRGSDKSPIGNFREYCETLGIIECHGHDGAFGATINKKNISMLYGMLARDIDKFANLQLNEKEYYVYHVYDATDLSDINIKNISKYNYLFGNGVEEPLFVIDNIPLNMYTTTLQGEKQNRFDFTYKNIKFDMYSKSSLFDIVNDMYNIGDNLLVSVVGSFKMGEGNRPTVVIKDINYKINNNASVFGL